MFGRIWGKNSNVPLLQFLSPNYLGFPRKAHWTLHNMFAKSGQSLAIYLSCFNFANTAVISTF